MPTNPYLPLRAMVNETLREINAAHDWSSVKIIRDAIEPIFREWHNDNDLQLDAVALLVGKLWDKLDAQQKGNA